MNKTSVLTYHRQPTYSGLKKHWGALLKATRKLRLDIIFPFQLNVAIRFLKFIGDTNECKRLTQQMSLLPNHTLGRQLYLIMQENGVSLVPWYKEHDLKHALLGYQMTTLDEMRMQCFMWGNAGFYSLNTLISFCFIIWTPEMWEDATYHFRAGRLVKPVAHYRIANCIEKDLATFRNEIDFENAIIYFNQLNQ